MKFFIQNYLFIFLLKIVVSCSTDHSSHESIQTANEIEYAENLEIVEHKDYTLIHILDPETHSIEKRFLIAKKSNQKKDGYVTLEIPITSIITLSSTHIGMLSKIDATNFIKGVSNHIYVNNPDVLKRFKQGKVIELGDEGSNSMETIISSKAKLLMYSGFGKEFSHEKQLEQLGITCVANYDWRENHPLGRAEWIKLYGYLTGKEKEAKSYFDQVVKEYKATVELAKRSNLKPTVFSGNMVGEVWHLPAGESYNAVLFRDANSKYVYADSKGTGSLDKSFEQIFRDNQKTDYWLNPGVETKKELLDFEPRYAHFEAVKKSHVYTYTQTGNRFWELSGIEPHHVLQDLIIILHPELEDKRSLHFYKKLKE